MRPGARSRSAGRASRQHQDQCIATPHRSDFILAADVPDKEPSRVS
jgi:hypothetical protein